MSRIVYAFLATLAVGAAGCTEPDPPSKQKVPAASVAAVDTSGFPGERVVKSKSEWRKQLTNVQYEVTREAGTEYAFKGEYWDEKRSGTYACVCCDLDLFASTTKFKSGTGWPSFYEPMVGGHVAEHSDTKFGWNRTEVTCARCDAHLGHVFDDGPAPTGLRYCINSAALNLKPDVKPDMKPAQPKKQTQPKE